MRQPKCKECRRPFTPTGPMQFLCGSPVCTSAYRRKHLARSSRLASAAPLKRTPKLGHSAGMPVRPPRERRASGAGEKRFRDLMHDATEAFNAYIRARDAHLPCVSCGCWKAIEWHAGHYMPVGARPELRFDEANVHRQCSVCNTTRCGNRAPYRITLIARIGLDEVRRLERWSAPRKWMRDELVGLARQYTTKLAQALASHPHPSLFTGLVGQREGARP